MDDGCVSEVLLNVTNGIAISLEYIVCVWTSFIKSIMKM